MLLWTSVYMYGGVVESQKIFKSVESMREYFDTVVGDMEYVNSDDFDGDYDVDMEHGVLYYWNGLDNSNSVELTIRLVEVE